MSIFQKIFESMLVEDNASSTAFGAVDSGKYGNQFPSQNSNAYNVNDNRPIDPSKAILGSKKKGKKTRFKIMRRNKVSM